MRRYTEPEMICRSFEAENIVTGSDPLTYENSATKLANSFKSEYGADAGDIIKTTWADMTK